MAQRRIVINSAPSRNVQMFDLTKSKIKKQQILHRKQPETKLNRRKLIRSGKKKSSKILRRPSCSTEPNIIKNTNMSQLQSPIEDNERKVSASGISLSSCDEKIQSHMRGIFQQYTFAKAAMGSANDRKEKVLTEKLRASDVENTELRAKVVKLENELAQVKKQKNTCIVCKKECFRFCGMECFK